MRLQLDLAYRTTIQHGSVVGFGELIMVGPPWDQPEVAVVVELDIQQLVSGIFLNAWWRAGI